MFSMLQKHNVLGNRLRNMNRAYVICIKNITFSFYFSGNVILIDSVKVALQDFSFGIREENACSLSLIKIIFLLGTTDSKFN